MRPNTSLSMLLKVCSWKGHFSLRAQSFTDWNNSQKHQKGLVAVGEENDYNGGNIKVEVKTLENSMVSLCSDELKNILCSKVGVLRNDMIRLKNTAILSNRKRYLAIATFIPKHCKIELRQIFTF